MSKLKAKHAFDAYRTYVDNNYSTEFDLVYFKSEADKYIKELQGIIAQLEDDVAYWKMNHGNAENAMHETEEYAMQLYRSDRYQKRKRCLAMARIASDDWHLHYTFYQMGHKDFELKKCERYNRHRKRWVELAKKFKDKEAK